MIEPALRPLSQVDEVAERIQSSSAASDDFEVAAAQQAAQQAAQRVTRETRLVAVLLIGLVSVMLLAALAWGRRPQPRSGGRPPGAVTRSVRSLT